MSIFHNSALIGASGQSTGYRIERSLRFNSPDSANLSRTPASASNRKTWTWAAWVKRCKSGNEDRLLYAGSITYFMFSDNVSDALTVANYNGSTHDWRITTSRVFRDFSAWYHIVIAFDTTQATASNRIKIYVNGVQETAFATSVYPNQNTDWAINNNIAHNICGNAGGNNYANVYLADVHFIDGQALTPSSFAETNTTTGQWVPKTYSGTYGTNGFKLNFSDNSGTTSTTLGKDTSGNGNNWTPNNLSVTAGAGNDSLVDTPTSYGIDTGAGGSVRGNYCTLNPIARGGGTLSNGNLQTSTSSTTPDVGNIAMTTGKWYWEVTLTTSSNPRVGVYNIGAAAPADFGATANGWCLLNSPSRVFNNNSASSYGTFSGASGNIVMVAYDADAGRLWYGENGSWFASGNPATNSNPSQTSVTGSAIVAASSSGTGSNVHDFNFGQRPFAYTAPSGFKALCDTNLPAPTIANGATAMDVKLYTGTGSTQTISDLSFGPDLVWTKHRGISADHRLYDTVRGATNRLFSSATLAESADGGSLTAFGSNGFTVGASADSNQASQSFVAWAWDAGSSTVTNTQGSITSSVRANTSSGVSVVTYTSPNNTANQTVGHGLGIKPSLIIVKNRVTTYNWDIYHSSLGFNSSLIFTTAGTRSGAFGAEPTSTVFTTVNNYTHNSTDTYVAYCFAPVSSFSSFGTYIGNGSSDGPFVYTGHRSAFVIIKSTSTNGGNWMMYDNKRASSNLNNKKLAANTSLQENEVSNLGDDTLGIDVLSNGFKIRQGGANHNDNGVTYVYAAFAENPLKYSRAR